MNERGRGLDPLGKRALFWAPAERREDPAEDVGAHGRRALFTATEPAGAGDMLGRDDARRPGEMGAGTRRPGGVPARLLAMASRQVPPVTVECSGCGGRSELDVARFAALHLPVWMWRPGRGHTHWMTCPSCSVRTWLSASWPILGR